MKITILGAGAFGTALSQILQSNHHDATFYDPLKYPDVTLEAAVAPAEALILAAPSENSPALLQQLPNKNLPLVNASKGFLSLAPFQNFPNFSIISGGAFAQDLTEKHPVTLTATSQLPIDLFQTDWLKFEYSPDNLGVLLCGTLKNIYAIGAGEKSLRQDTSAFDHYIASALAEIKYFLAANNCNPATADAPCGQPDLIITCASNQSRNYQFGQQLTKHNHLDLSRDVTATTEGLTAIQHLPASSLNIPAGCEILTYLIERVQRATQ